MITNLIQLGTANDLFPVAFTGREFGTANMTIQPADNLVFPFMFASGPYTTENTTLSGHEKIIFLARFAVPEKTDSKPLLLTFVNKIFITPGKFQMRVVRVLV